MSQRATMKSHAATLSRDFVAGVTSHLHYHRIRNSLDKISTRQQKYTESVNGDDNRNGSASVEIKFKFKSQLTFGTRNMSKLNVVEGNNVFNVWLSCM